VQTADPDGPASWINNVNKLGGKSGSGGGGSTGEDVPPPEDADAPANGEHDDIPF